MYLGDTPEASAEVWNKLPPLYWLLEAPDLKRGARVLAEADHPGLLTRDGRRLPVILLQYVGAGKVLFHATDETWRWRYRAGDVYFARYWSRHPRPGPLQAQQGDRSVKLAADQPKYARGEPVRLVGTFCRRTAGPGREDGVTVTLEHQGHRTRQVQLHRNLTGGAVFETVLSDLGAGAYHAFLGVPTPPGEPPSYNFEVVAPGEFDRVQMDVQAMQRAARQTKGGSTPCALPTGSSMTCRKDTAPRWTPRTSGPLELGGDGVGVSPPADRRMGPAEDRRDGVEWGRIAEC